MTAYSTVPRAIIIKMPAEPLTCASLEIQFKSIGVNFQDGSLSSDDEERIGGNH